MEIAPSLLSADFKNLEKEVKTVSSADLLHLDVMDGHFVPNITFGPSVISSLREITDLPFDTHLMISEPERYLEEFAEAGSDYLTVHLEACPHIHRVLQKIEELGPKPAVSINPGTPVDSLDPVLDKAEMVLVMSVNPGFSGQDFIESVVPKISYLKENFSGKIEVDGGVNPSTAHFVKDADIAVAGSAIFGKEDREKAINELREAL